MKQNNVSNFMKFQGMSKKDGMILMGGIRKMKKTHWDKSIYIFWNDSIGFQLIFYFFCLGEGEADAMHSLLPLLT